MNEVEREFVQKALERVIDSGHLRYVPKGWRKETKGLLVVLKRGEEVTRGRARENLGCLLLQLDLPLTAQLEIQAVMDLLAEGQILSPRESK